jgi:hypothetical protein
MRVAGHRRLSPWEWVAIFGILAISVAGSKAAIFSPVWQNVVEYTSVVFACLCIALRSAWGRRSFWLALAVAIAVHCIAVLFAVREFPATVARDFHGFPQIASGVLEGLLILGFLWRASTKKSSQRPS